MNPSQSAERLAAFELPNVGVGDDPFALAEAAADDETDAIVLLFQRAYYCGNCRRQVKRIARAYDRFTDRDALVVSILPVSRERAATWLGRTEIPFPLLADPDAEMSDEMGQPVRFGTLGSLHDLIGRMPLALVLDVTDDHLTVHRRFEGSLPHHRPGIDELLAAVDTIRGTVD